MTKIQKPHFHLCNHSYSYSCSIEYVLWHNSYLPNYFYLSAQLLLWKLLAPFAKNENLHPQKKQMSMGSNAANREGSQKVLRDKPTHC